MLYFARSAAYRLQALTFVILLNVVALLVKLLLVVVFLVLLLLGRAFRYLWFLLRERVVGCRRVRGGRCVTLRLFRTEKRRVATQWHCTCAEHAP